MRKLSFFILTILFISNSYGQLSTEGEPLSKNIPKLKSTESSGYTLKSLNIDKLIQRDIEEGIHNRYANFKKLNINLKEEGSVTPLTDGTLWNYTITHENAFALGLHFKHFQIPSGARLFVYNHDYSHILGAFTHINNKENKAFSIADLPGNELNIEYFEPNNVTEKGILIIGGVTQAYKDIFQKSSLDTQNSDDVDINCPEGDTYQLEKHSAAKITFNDGVSGFLCSGALINNINNDGTPYFLTANHCISDLDVAQTLITYFNFEAETCSGDILEGKTLSGSILMATWQASDMTLLRLEEIPPPSYQPYFAGWNAESNDTLVAHSVSIHHPAGIEKKIAVDLDDIYSFPFEVSWEDNVVTPPNSHWYVEYDIGDTEGGSSGSPLFDSQKRIVGQLHGGGDDFDLYGKLSSSWSGGKSISQKLQPWLDPSNSGQLTHAGYYPENNDVDAQFYAEFTNVCLSSPTSFINTTNFEADSFSWKITPASFEFIDSTNENSFEPKISFLESTTYSIELTAYNDSVISVKTRNDYINVNGIQISIQTNSDTVLCPDNTTDIKLYAHGAESYQWNIIDENDCVFISDSSQLKTSTLILKKKPGFIFNSATEIIAELHGSHGTCSDSTSLTIRYDVPENDNIENALQLELGISGPYTNDCSTVEPNEPYPVGGDCNSQANWCDCERSDTLIENTLWFTFNGPASGIIGINAPGFDNQIAIYEANSYGDIISGDKSKYTIVAANDDYFGESKDYSALITGATVTSGKKYWLQVDGSACGATGEFNLELYDFDIENSFPTATKDVITNHSNEISIYPNPAKDIIHISGIDETYSVRLVDMNGRLISILGLSEQEQYTLPAGLQTGIYLVQLSNKSDSTTRRLFIE